MKIHKNKPSSLRKLKKIKRDLEKLASANPELKQEELESLLYLKYKKHNENIIEKRKLKESRKRRSNRKRANKSNPHSSSGKSVWTVSGGSCSSG